MRPPSATNTWRHRARELARERNLTHTARYEVLTVDNRELFSVPTCSRYGSEHVVRHDRETGELLCDCTAGSYQRPCAHAGAVLGWLDARAEAERPRRRSEIAAELARELAWNDYWAQVERQEQTQEQTQPGMRREAPRWV